MVSEEGTLPDNTVILYTVWWLRSDSYHLLWYTPFNTVLYTESCAVLFSTFDSLSCFAHILTTACHLVLYFSFCTFIINTVIKHITFKEMCHFLSFVTGLVANLKRKFRDFFLGLIHSSLFLIHVIL